jgi:hypothetical protein
MAGGRGSRLGPLTLHRSEPAVPFGGRYRKYGPAALGGEADEA